MSAQPRHRILIVTRNLPPLVGGMERLNWHLAEELSKVADVRIIGPEGAAAVAPAGVPVREAPLKPLWKFLLRARALARQEARRWQPDVVLAGSGLTAPLARAAARTCGAKTAVYVHGLDVAVKHPAYRAVWIPALRRMDRVIANSRATAALCRDIGIDPARIGIVHPGVDLPSGPAPTQFPGHSGAGPQGRNPESSSGVTGEAKDWIPGSARMERGQPRNDEPGIFENQMVIPGLAAEPAPDLIRGRNPESGSSVVLDEIGTNFRTRHHLANRPLLLSVGRLSTRKGLREFVTLALPQIVAMHPDVMLLIVGDAPHDALHAEAQTPDSIRAAAEQAGVAANLRFLGTITDYQELGAVYRAADVHVFPVREIVGDPEGFGMVAVEAAAHGLPTVAFATGGVVDAVSENQSGHLVPPGDYAALADAVLRVLAAPDAMRDSCLAFARGFAWPTFGARTVAELGVATRGSDAADRRDG